MRTEMRYISDDGTIFENRLDCLKYEEDQEEAARVAARDEFLKNIGFDRSKFATKKEMNKAIRDSYIVFTSCGEIVFLAENIVTTEDYDNLKDLLRANKFYANALSGFVDSSLDFYKMDMIEKLETLGWDVNNGTLANTMW